MRKTHGETTGGPTRIYRIWVSMRHRITNPNSHHFKYYGGRGISICTEWGIFPVFKKWAMAHGYTDNLTIDRINNNGNYEPSNCRRVTRKVNNQNKIYRKDYGIFPKKNGYYVQITVDGDYYCGGYSTDISKVRKYKIDLLRKIRTNAIKPKDLKRKRQSQDAKTGRIIWTETDNPSSLKGMDYQKVAG